MIRTIDIATHQATVKSGISSTTLRWSLTAIFMIGMSLPALAASPVIQYEYDANGNLTKITDGLSHATTHQYDALNRLIRQNQPHPSSTGQLGQVNLQYNGLNQLTGVTDPRSLSTTYTKNAFGDTLTQVSPDTGTSTYTYDAAGNVMTKTDARGKTLTYTYDAANRVTGISGTGDTSILAINYAYTYDQGTNGLGRLTQVSHSAPAGGSTSWSYDARGHVIRKTSIISSNMFDLQMQYDVVGRLTRIIYPSTHYVDYTYNTNGQVRQIWVDSNLMVDNIQYHPTGAVKSWAWANGQNYARMLDSDGRIASYTVGDQLQSVGYDNAGRVNQLQRAAVTTPTTAIASSLSQYTYDNLDRLIGNVTATTIQNYQYDLNGNRTQLGIGSGSYAYTIDSNSNRLLDEAGPVAKEYTYDATGNVESHGSDIYYSYYVDGRLWKISTTDNTYTITYNGLGQRVAIHQMRYVYDEAGHIIGEYDAMGDLKQETVYLGDIPVLTLRPSPEQLTAQANSTTGAATAIVTGTWAGTTTRTHTATASTSDNVTYNFTPPSSQTFRVYARWTAGTSNATNAQYTIDPNTSGSTPTTVAVDQTKDGGIWNYLGSYSLSTANALTVTLSGQGNGAIVADAIRIVPASTASVQSITYNIYTDHLNMPREIRDYANQQRWLWYPEQAEAFGANLPDENPASVGTFEYNLRFPGQIYHPISQSTYNYYRDYDPRTGRYIESDPIGLAGGINTYAYVGGNPLGAVDPRGLWAITVGAYAGAGAELTFGRDPNTGGGFMTGRIGLGVGGGIKWEGSGGRPSSQENTSCNAMGKGIGDYVDVGFNIGPLQAGINGQIGVNSNRDGTVDRYGKFGPNWSIGDSIGIKAGAAVGFEGTVYDKRR